MNNLNRPLYKVYPTKYILSDLDNHIKNKLPFSTIRYGDGCLGMIASYLTPGLIKRGKWSGGDRCVIANSALNSIGIQKKDRRDLILRIVEAGKNSNYIDSYDSFFTGLESKKGIGLLASNQMTIYKSVGIDIDTKRFCNPFLHYFSIVDGEYNLFDIMKNRKVFCISNNMSVCDKLCKFSHAHVVHSFIIPRSGNKLHYPKFFSSVMNTIKNNVKKYDLFLVGAGFLGKIYCDYVKQLGGVAFDSGRLFDLWDGIRVIDSRPKRFIRMNLSKMLCNRIKLVDKGGIW